MGNNPIEQIMETSMSKLRTLVDANTVMGTPIKNEDGSIILPFSKVSMGFVAGGGEYGEMPKNQTMDPTFAGGSGAGLSVSPIGFLIFKDGKCKIVNMEDKSNLIKTLEKLPDLAKSVIENLGSTPEERGEN